MRSLSLDFQIKTALTGSFSDEKSFYRFIQDRKFGPKNLIQQSPQLV